MLWNLLARMLGTAAVIAVILLAVFTLHLVRAGFDPRKAYAGFRGTMEAFGAFMGRLLLTVFFFTVVVPFALIARRQDPMRVHGPARWIPRKTRDLTLADARKQH